MQTKCQVYSLSVKKNYSTWVISVCHNISQTLLPLTSWIHVGSIAMSSQPFAVAGPVVHHREVRCTPSLLQGQLDPALHIHSHKLQNLKTGSQKYGLLPTSLFNHCIIIFFKVHIVYLQKNLLTLEEILQGSNGLSLLLVLHQ